MKKILLLLLVPLIAIAFISCELDVISGFMGAVGSNVLVDQGIIQVDDSAAINAANTLNEIDLDDIDTDKVASIKENIAEAVQSPQKKAKLKEEMSKPAPEDVKKEDLIPDGIDGDLKDFLEDLLPDDLTQGDVLAVVMVRDLADKLNDLTANPDPDESEVMEFVSETLQTVEIIKAVSSIDEITIDALINDLMKNLMDASKGMARAVSRDGGNGESGDGVEEYIAMIAPLAQSFINAAGKLPDGSINPDGLNRLIASYKMIRTSYDNLAASIDKKDVNVALGLDDLFNYLVSVIMTEAHNFLKLDDGTYGSKVTMAMVLNDLANLDPHATEPPSFFSLKEPEDWEEISILYAGADGQKIKPMLTTFANTVKVLVRKIEKGAIDDLVDIDELLAELEESLFGDN